MGAVFDSLSFFITIFIVRRALKTKKTLEYIGHLSLDVVIAVIATFWVLWVFSFSGWIISIVEAKPQLLESRNEQYEQMLINALKSPIRSSRNIYFGLIMGISASLPTCIHVYLFLRSLIKSSLKDTLGT